MKRLTVIVAFLWSMIFGVVGNANASLITADLVQGSGDGYITHDTNTGLSWLDLTRTVGWSVENVVNSSYLTSGFRYANPAEITQLVADMGWDYTDNLPSGFLGEQQKLGVTQTYFSLYYTLYRSSGIYWNGVSIQLNTIDTIVGLTEPSSLSFYIDNLEWSYNSSLSTIGHFLVKEEVPSPIPAPPAFLLMLTGLGVLVLSKCRRTEV